MKKTLGFILCMLMILSSVAFAVPVMVGTVDVVNENQTIITEENFAEVMAETDYNIPKDSKLVFDMSFDNGRTFKNYLDVKSYGSYGSDFVDKDGKIPTVVTGTNGNNNIYFDWANGAEPEYASVTNTAYTAQNDALTIKNTATAAGEKYPLLYFRAGNGSDNAFADGRYTICAEISVKPDSNIEYVQYSGLFYNSGDKGLGSDFKFSFDTVNGTKTYLTLDVLLYEGKVYCYNKSGVLSKVQDYGTGTMKKFGLIMIPKFKAAGTSHVYIDNFRMYYKPLECTPGTYVVNFDANGKKDVVLPSKKTGVTTIDLSSTKLSDIGTSRFVGWATSPVGAVVTSLTLTDDTTLYAIWDDYFYVPDGEGANNELVFSSHFNSTYTTFKNKSVADAKIGTTGSGYAKASVNGLTLSDGNSRANYEVKDISNADDELVLVTKGTNASETWPALWMNTVNNGVYADGVYTLYAEVSVFADKELEYVQYNPAISGKKSGANNTRAGSKLNLAVDGTKSYISVVVTVHNGNIYYGTNMSKDSVVHDASTTYRLGINFNVKAKTEETTNTKIFVDNLRMYYRSIHKALSYSENSIRVNSPAGIRFKSSVSKLTRESASLTEYGYIVTRKVILDAKGVNGADFTMENEAMKDAYVKGVSYGMENGKKVDRIFESDSVNTFFTAAVYNIPADKYDDVIVVRPFVKIGEEIIYGEPMAASILEVANRIASSEDYENFKETVDKILNGEEI